MAKPVSLQAIYKSHRTTIDGGFVLSFDLTEDMAEAINQVYHKRESNLYVVVMTEDEFNSQRVKTE